jgi:hypothetical protein
LETKSYGAELIDRYLLGELSDEERDRLEGDYFADPVLLEELHAARDEMIDAYLRGELPPGRSERFERYFMASPRRRERVEFAKALMQVHAARTSPAATEERRDATSWWQALFALFFAHRQLAFAAAALILVAVGSWVAFRLYSSRGQGGGDDRLASVRPEQTPPAPVPSPQPEATPSGVTTEPAAAPTPAPPPEQTRTPVPRRESRVLAFALTSGLVRGDDEPERLVIPRGTEVVLLRFGLEDEGHKTYRASLRTPEGEEVPLTSSVRVSGTKTARTATLRVPARLLKDGDYILRLNGTAAGVGETNVARFYFRVEKR